MTVRFPTAIRILGFCELFANCCGADLLPMNRAHRPSLQGSVFWMAPEVVQQKAYTFKADIWSVGCLVVEMLTGEHPWPHLSQMQAIFKVRSYPLTPFC